MTRYDMMHTGFISVIMIHDFVSIMGLTPCDTTTALPDDGLQKLQVKPLKNF